MIDKVCPKCGRKPPAITFGKNKRKHDGLQTWCKDCQKQYDKKYYTDNTEYHKKYVQEGRQRLKQLVDEYKTNQGCSIVGCNINDPCCLDFHHPNDNKECTISKEVAAGCTQKVLKEITKCIVICANHHRQLHAGRNIRLRGVNGT